jgi:hypothetical protein
MRKSYALILLTVISPCVLLAMMVDVVALHWFAAPLICALPVLLIVVATGESAGRHWGLLVLWVVLTGSWLGLLWLSSTRSFEQPAEGDIMRVLVLMLVGLGVVPLVLTAWLYARDFLSRGLTAEDLQRLRNPRDQ